MRIAFAAAILGCGSVALAQPAGKPRAQTPSAPTPAAPVQRERTTRVDNGLGFVIQKGTETGLDVQEVDRGGFAILDGEASFKPEQLNKPGLDRRLRLDRFAPASDTLIVQVVFSPKVRGEAFVHAMEQADKSKPPVLIDSKGRKYQPVGYIWTSPDLVKVRFTRGHPIGAFSELPAVSRATPDRELTLVYAVNTGAEITALRVGDATLEAYEPPIQTQGVQK